MSPRIRYAQVKDGEEIAVPPDLKQKSACGDCGLVHRYHYAVIVTGAAKDLPHREFMRLMRSLKLRVTKRVWRDDRATAGRRRAAKVRGSLRAIALKRGERKPS